MRGWTWIGSCVQDLRFGSRILVKSPGITLAVILSLALGLGATTALFSLLNSLLFKALPVPEPARLIVLHHGSGAELEGVFTYPQLAMLREEAKDAADLFGYSGGGASRLQYADLDREVQVQFVSGDAFRILKIAPILGRLLEGADDTRGSGSGPVAVISYRFWQSAFHGEPSVIGRKILIDSVPFVIIGVTPPTFFGVQVGGYADITLPFASKLALLPEFKMLDCKNCYWVAVMGRLKPRVGTGTAEAGLNVVWKNALRATIPETLPERYKAEYLADHIALAPGASGLSDLRDRFTKPLYVLLAMTGVILLISCSNVANLLTARSACPPAGVGGPALHWRGARPPGAPVADGERLTCRRQSGCQRRRVFLLRKRPALVPAERRTEGVSGHISRLASGRVCRRIGSADSRSVWPRSGASGDSLPLERRPGGGIAIGHRAIFVRPADPVRATRSFLFVAGCRDPVGTKPP